MYRNCTATFRQHKFLYTLLFLFLFVAATNKKKKKFSKYLQYTFNILTKVFSTIENIQHLLLHSFNISADLLSECKRDDALSQIKDKQLNQTLNISVSNGFSLHFTYFTLIFEVTLESKTANFN